MEMKAKLIRVRVVCENVNLIMVKTDPRNVHSFGYFIGYGK